MSVPVLSYIGSVDTSSSSSGTVMFSIDFDASMSLLMFEYKYQPTSVSNPNPTNLQYSGFIYPDSVQPVQGSNHIYYLPIPALSSEDIGNTSYDVAVRVYSSTSLDVTEWSNSLTVHRPPEPVVVSGASYVNGTTHATLYVDLSGSLVNGVEYMVSYYYIPAADSDTKWVVSELLTPDGSLLTIEMADNVGGSGEIYVAVNAVTSFIDGYDTFYCVSEISNTVTATVAEIVPPALEPVDYYVYNSGVQTMNLLWSAPSSGFVPGFTVDYYQIYRKINNGSFTLLANNVNSLSYDVDVSNTTTYPVLNTTVSFYVVGVLSNGGLTPNSDTESKNIFYYSDAPSSLYYNWAMYDDESPNDVTVSFTFENPSSTGSGAVGSFKWGVYQDGVLLGSLSTTAYGSGPYIENTSFTYDSESDYTIRVLLQTTDTNSSDTMDGDYNETSNIVPSRVPFIYEDSVDNSGIITFKVSTGVGLNPVALIAFVPDAGSESVVTYSTNIEPEVITVGGITTFVYQFSVDTGVEAYVPQYVITASNQAGIGYKVFVD